MYSYRKSGTTKLYVRSLGQNSIGSPIKKKK